MRLEHYTYGISYVKPEDVDKYRWFHVETKSNPKKSTFIWLDEKFRYLPEDSEGKNIHIVAKSKDVNVDMVDKDLVSIVKKMKQLPDTYIGGSCSGHHDTDGNNFWATQRRITEDYILEARKQQSDSYTMALDDLFRNVSDTISDSSGVESSQVINLFSKTDDIINDYDETLPHTKYAFHRIFESYSIPSGMTMKKPNLEFIETSSTDGSITLVFDFLSSNYVWVDPENQDIPFDYTIVKSVFKQLKSSGAKYGLSVRKLGRKDALQTNYNLFEPLDYAYKIDVISISEEQSITAWEELGFALDKIIGAYKKYIATIEMLKIEREIRKYRDDYVSNPKPKKVRIEPADNDEKKYMATFTYKDGKTKRTYFGAAGMSDYTKHKDYDRMKRYLKRHGSVSKTKSDKEDWSDPTTAGALSRWILWNKPSLRESFNDYKKRFKLEGTLKSK